MQVLDLLRAELRALHLHEIATRLGVPRADALQLRRLLDELVSDGVVRSLAGQRYRATRLAEHGMREGTLYAHPRGFGFVRSAIESESVFIASDAMGGAMHGDWVEARVVARTARGLEGCIERVVRRGQSLVAGIVRHRGRSTWLEPDDDRIRGPIVLLSTPAVRDGDAAVVRLTRYPETRDENPEATLLQALGRPGEVDVETKKILLCAGVTEQLPPEAVAEADRIPEVLDEQAFAGRSDLRAIAFVTVDPQDARDHDDAVWVGATKSGFDVWVAIADVTAYVPQGSAIDLAARERGFSIYLPDRAVAMLPDKLASRVCSLLENEDRLCVAVEMHLSRTAKLQSMQVLLGVMQSKRRLTYEDVATCMQWIDGSAEVSREDRAMLATADRLARILRRRRMRRGALDLSVHEPQVLLDESGAPRDVVRRAQDAGVKRAYEIIEELMVLTNEAVAAWIIERGLPAVYRVHSPPDEAKLMRVVEVCERLGIQLPEEDTVDARSLTACLANLGNTGAAQVVSAFLLRSLSRAAYDCINIGHYGLASAAYVHFTSPIRRYPDLMIHRVVKQGLRAAQASNLAAELDTAARECTARERTVADVERDVVDVARAWVLRSCLGKVVQGTIADILSSSITVMLDQPFAFVRVPFAWLGNDSYEATEDELEVVAARSGERLRLGDNITVCVEDVNVSSRFVLCRRIWKSTPPRNLRDSRELARGRGRHTPKRSKYNRYF